MGYAELSDKARAVLDHAEEIADRMNVGTNDRTELVLLRELYPVARALGVILILTRFDPKVVAYLPALIQKLSVALDPLAALLGGEEDTAAELLAAIGIEEIDTGLPAPTEDAFDRMEAEDDGFNGYNA